MWGDNLYSENFAGVMALDTYNFYTFQLVFWTPPTLLQGFVWNLAGVLHHKSRFACVEIIHVPKNFVKGMALDTYNIYTFKLAFSTPPNLLHGFEWNLAEVLHHKSWFACGEIIHVPKILQELWLLTLILFTHFSFLLSFSYIVAWIWMKLGRSVAPQV